MKQERKEKGTVMVIKTVIRLSNDMVMVFDAEGEQVPGYQGQYDDVRETILRDARGAEFNHWFGLTLEPETVPGKNW